MKIKSNPVEYSKVQFIILNEFEEGKPSFSFHIMEIIHIVKVQRNQTHNSYAKII